MMLGTVQEAVCNSAMQIAHICCLCGNTLSFDEISFNVATQHNKNRFLCQKCRRLVRGKEEGAQAAEAKIEAAAAVASPSSPFLGGAAAEVEVDHFYECSESRQLIDEATWEFLPDDVKKPRKIIVGKRKRNLVLKKKKPQKKELTVDSDSAVLLLDAASPLQNVWMYALPSSELGPHVQLQVAHGDDVFTTFSKNPAHELWCQGARCVVVTEDGYTFFDIEKNQRLFFSQKQAIEAHLAAQGFRSDFKVLIKDEYPVIRVSDQGSLSEVFTHCETRMSEAFEKYQHDTKRNDEKYDAQVDSILEKLSKL